MRGILGFSAYLPYRRLDRAEIAPFVGQGGGTGTRTVASFDEDPTTMGVEAARGALRGTDAAPDLLLFGTSFPAYADKTNATAVHAALRLGAASAAFDLGASARSAVGGLLLALTGSTAALAVSADIRTGLPGGADEAAGGDAAAAFVVGSDADGTVVAEFLGSASVTDEFVERWRAPGETRTRIWDERFSEVVYTPLGVAAWNAALERAGLTASDVSLAAVAAPTARVSRAASEESSTVCRSSTTCRARSATPVPRTQVCCWSRCWSRPSPGRSSHWCRATTAPTYCCSAPPTRSAATGTRAERAHDRRAGRARRPGVVPQVPLVARRHHDRAAASPRAEPGLVAGGGARRGMEVRVRRFEGA